MITISRRIPSIFELCADSGYHFLFISHIPDDHHLLLCYHVLLSVVPCLITEHLHKSPLSLFYFVHTIYPSVYEWLEF